MSRSILIRIVCLLSIFAGSGVFAQTAAAIEVDIPAQPVGDALNQFAEQSGLQVVLYADDAEGVETTAVAGKFDDSELVLDALLASTGLEYFFINDRTVSVSSLDDDQGGSDSGNARPAPILMAQNTTQTQTTVSSRSDDDVTEAREDELSVPLEEIVVTGTNLRGVEDSASPLFNYSREDIAASGAATVGEFIDRSVPQNFASGASLDNGLSNRAGSNRNLGAGSGVNLRGLGNNSTLVLLNGRRVAASGFASFTDISQIPLAAVERVDILTDGASAVYGSDAVGGVINFVLRDDYEGAETRFRYGTVTDGDLSEYQASQAFGAGWGSGNAIFAYEYFDRDALDAADRELTADAFLPLDVSPSQKRHSLFFNGSQDVTDTIKVFATALYSTRDAEQFNSFGPFMEPSRADATADQLNVSAGAVVNLGDNWRTEFAGTYTQDKIESTDFSGDPLVSRPGTMLDYTGFIIDAKIDGDLFAMPGGAAKIAIGGQYRDEDLINETSIFGRVVTDRDVSATFAEVSLPFIGDTNSSPGFRRLELTSAVRYEDYSDFGDTTNPKVGILWSPVDSVNLRGTWSTSFRAPSLNEIDESNFIVAILDFVDPSATSGSTVGALLLGNNARVTPEEADTWTAGIDFAPTSVPGLSAGLTFFKIEYEDRIAAPSFAQAASGFTDPSTAPLITRPVTLSEVQAFIDRTSSPLNFVDFSAGQGGAASVEAIVDGSSRNTSLVNIEGLDFDATYSFGTDFGDWGLFVNGTYLFSFEEQFSPLTPANDVVGVAFQPPELRFRTGVSWNKDAFSMNAFLNYVDDLENQAVVPSAPIDSWTTVDARFGVNFEELSSNRIFKGASGFISVTNLFDDQPPRVDNPGNDFGQNFDAENHDITGRFIAFGITKEW